MKSILIITAFPPSTRTAGQAYTLRLINDLACEYNVGLIYFKNIKDNVDYPIDPRIRVEKIIPINIINSIINCVSKPFLFPLYTKRFSIRQAICLHRIERKYDFLYYDFSQTHLYALFGVKKPSFLMIHDVIAQKYKRIGNIFFYIMARITESIILSNTNNLKFCFSEKDRRILLHYYNSQTRVVDFYIDPAIEKVKVGLDGCEFCFYGAWNREENYQGLIWFIENVMSMLNKQIGITVIGGGVSKFLQTLLHQKGIRYTGYVNDPYSIIAKSCALVVPLFYGAGVKMKVVEALACGTIVIGTKIAFEGIDFIDKNSLFLAETAGDFASSIKMLQMKCIETIDRTTIINEKELRKARFRANYPRYKFVTYLQELKS